MSLETITTGILAIVTWDPMSEGASNVARCNVTFTNGDAFDLAMAQVVIGLVEKQVLEGETVVQEERKIRSRGIQMNYIKAGEIWYQSLDFGAVMVKLSDGETVASRYSFRIDDMRAFKVQS